MALTALRGVGPKTAAAAEDLGLERIEDVLTHIPRAYAGPPPHLPYDQLVEGEEAAVLVRTHTVGSFRGGSRRGQGRLIVTVSDREPDRGAGRAVWFNQPWLASQLESGQLLLLIGVLKGSEFVVGSHQVVDSDEGGGGGGGRPADLATAPWRAGLPVPAEIESRRPLPLHPASERLPARGLRRLAWQSLARAEDRPEALPVAIRAQYRLPGAADALRAVHFPALGGREGEERLAEQARRRLAFEELLLHQLVLRRRRQGRAGRRAPALSAPGPVRGAWLDSLPFRLTGDQERVIGELDAELGSGEPMRRMLMGEVGSGKTVVALAAMLRAAENRCQAVLMAPTEVLAEQHAATLQRLLEGTGHQVALLTGSVGAARRRPMLRGLAAGEVELVVGTHALLEQPVEFARLALCVIDEQHRFGVRQRAVLDGKGSDGLTPHLLHMSATPIPRTLALLGYGDLDLSELRQLPPGRRPVETVIVTEQSRAAQFAELRQRLQRGEQAYVVCPLVSESEAVQAKAALREAERLRGAELSGFELAVLHGQMRPAEKQEVMARFEAGHAAVLVATTVVEVGVDVPNATTIVIEGAERFGLAQLHQLRGRVGRGSRASHCLLVPGRLGARGRRRLEAVAAERDGFRLAELDLRMRGAGEVLGARQHGLPGFRAARLPEDEAILAAAGREAARLAADREQPGVELLELIAESRFGGVDTERIAA